MGALFDLDAYSFSGAGTGSTGISIDLSSLEASAGEYVNKKTGGALKTAIAGGGIGNAILPGIGALIGGTLGALLGAIKGKTPHLPDANVWATAQAVEQSLWKSGILDYQSDPAFRESFRNSAVEFIMNSNPGQSPRRAYYVGQVNKIADAGGIALADLFAYEIHGVSTDPNDPTGIAWRIENTMQKVVTPVVKAYEKSKGIVPVTKEVFGMDAQQAGIFGIGLVILLGVLASGGLKGKA